MKKDLPYKVSVACALISGFVGFLAVCWKSKAAIHELQQQHQLALEAEREKFRIEIERLELEYKQQMERSERERGDPITGVHDAADDQSLMRSSAAQAHMQDIVNRKSDNGHETAMFGGVGFSNQVYGKYSHVKQYAESQNDYYGYIEQSTVKVEQRLSDEDAATDADAASDSLEYVEMANDPSEVKS